MIKKNGFTIIEVLLAMFILVSSVYVLSNLQIRSIFRVLKDRDEIDRVFLVKKELYLAMFDKEKSNKRTTTEIEDLSTKIVTEPVSVEKKSSLKDLTGEVRLLKSVGSWEKDMKKREIVMVSIISKPADKEEKKS